MSGPFRLLAIVSLVAVAALASAQSLEWRDVYDSADHDDESLAASMVDRFGNALVAGYSDQNGAYINDILFKYEPNGERTLELALPVSVRPRFIRQAPDDSYWLIGDWGGFSISKRLPSGSEVWRRHHSSEDVPAYGTVEFAPTGELHVAGTYDMFEYPNAAGVLVFHATGRWPGPDFL